MTLIFLLQPGDKKIITGIKCFMYLQTTKYVKDWKTQILFKLNPEKTQSVIPGFGTPPPYMSTKQNYDYI